MILHEYSLDAERARAVDQSCNHPTTMILNQHIALPADRSPHHNHSQLRLARNMQQAEACHVCLSLSASLSAGFIYIKERKT